MSAWRPLAYRSLWITQGYPHEYLETLWLLFFLIAKKTPKRGIAKNDRYAFCNTPYRTLTKLRCLFLFRLSSFRGYFNYDIIIWEDFGKIYCSMMTLYLFLFLYRFIRDHMFYSRASIGSIGNLCLRLLNGAKMRPNCAQEGPGEVPGEPAGARGGAGGPER